MGHGVIFIRGRWAFFGGRQTACHKGHVNINQVEIEGLVWLLFRLSAHMIINKKEYSSVYLYRCVRGVIFYEEGWAFFVGHPTIKYRGHCDSNQTYIRGLVWVIFRLCYINM